MENNDRQPLHTGEVVGSIPTTPTIKTPILQGFPPHTENDPQRFVTQRSANTTVQAGENPGTPFAGCSAIRRALRIARGPSKTWVIRQQLRVRAGATLPNIKTAIGEMIERNAEQLLKA